MGWLYRRGGWPADEDQACRDEWRGDGLRVVASKIVRPHDEGYCAVWYGAIEKTADGRAPYIFAAVTIIDECGGEWGTKAMDETVGPSPSKCPKAILSYLSPIADIEAVHGGRKLEWARAWRARCGRNEPPFSQASLPIAEEG